MTTTRRGVSSYSSAAPATSHEVPLPAGSVAGDLVILAASNPSFSASFTLPGTTVLNAGDNTMRYGVCQLRLAAADITKGTLTVGVSTSQAVTAVVVGYSSAGALGTPGTIYSKAGATLTTTQAASVPSNGGDDVLVFSLIKHSGSTQAYVSSSPATTDLKDAIQTGSGVPSAHVGVYTGTPITVTDTWQTSSSNGVGFQIPVSSTPPADSFEWTSGDPTTTGSVHATKNVTGAATITLSDQTVTGVGTYKRATYVADSAGSTADYTWAITSLDKYTIRYYLLTPASWAASRTAVMFAQNGSTYQIGNALAGTSAPGQFRWMLSNGSYVFQTPTGILNFSTIYRVETQVDTVAGTIRGAIFPRGSTTPIYDSGLVSAAVGSQPNTFKFGRLESVGSLPDFGISRVKTVHAVGAWIGPDATDPAVGPDIIGVWNGASADMVVYLGVWNGTSLDPASGFSVT